MFHRFRQWMFWRLWSSGSCQDRLLMMDRAIKTGCSYVVRLTWRGWVLREKKHERR